MELLRGRRRPAPRYSQRRRQNPSHRQPPHSVNAIDIFLTYAVPLKFQQAALIFDAARVSRNLAIRPNHTMTGNDQANRIFTQRSTHRLRRHLRQTASPCYSLSQFAISRGLPERYPQKQLPNLALELTCARRQMQDRPKIWSFTAKINIQPLPYFGKNRQFRS